MLLINNNYGHGIIDIGQYTEAELRALILCLRAGVPSVTTAEAASDRILSMADRIRRDRKNPLQQWRESLY